MLSVLGRSGFAFTLPEGRPTDVPVLKTAPGGLPVAIGGGFLPADALGTARTIEAGSAMTFGGGFALSKAITTASWIGAETRSSCF